MNVVEQAARISNIPFTREELDDMLKLPSVRVCIAEAVAAEREACAQVVEIRQVRVPEIFRGLGAFVNEDKDGWRDLTSNEKGILSTIAAAIRARGSA